MGAIISILDQGREAIGEALAVPGAETEMARDKAIGGVLAGVTDILEEPEYIGSIDEALVHHMGQEAFTDEEAVRRYLSLVVKIYGHSLSRPEEFDGKDIPVLFVFEDTEDEKTISGSTSVLVKIAPGGVRFSSESNRNFMLDEDDREIELEEGPLPSSLYILGDTVSINGDITKINSTYGEPEPGIGFMLRKVEGSADEGSTVTDRLEGEPTILVGWQEIEAVLAKRLTDRESSVGYKEALALRRFFEAEFGGLGKLKDEAPELGKILQQAQTVQHTLFRLSRIARRSVVE